MTELHDIVDRNDVVIGQATFDDAYDNHKIIRVAHCWLVNAQSQYLFQFRAAHKKSMPRRFDASVGGKLKAGESYDQAVIREIKEELGIDIPPPTYAGKYFVDRPHEYKFTGVYYALYDGTLTGWEEEAECLEWMSYAEAHALYTRFPYLFCSMRSLEIVHAAIQKTR